MSFAFVILVSVSLFLDSICSFIFGSAVVLFVTCDLSLYRIMSTSADQFSKINLKVPSIPTGQYPTALYCETKNFVRRGSTRCPKINILLLTICKSLKLGEKNLFRFYFIIPVFCWTRVENWRILRIEFGPRYRLGTYKSNQITLLKIWVTCLVLASFQRTLSSITYFPVMNIFLVTSCSFWKCRVS